MNDMKLTARDIDNLILAVEAWEAAPAHDRSMGELISGIMAGPIVRKQQEFNRDMDERAAKTDRMTRERKDLGIMLKAKLLMLREEHPPDDELPSLGSLRGAFRNSGGAGPIPGSD